MSYQDFAGAVVAWLSKYTDHPDKVAHAAGGLLIQGLAAWAYLTLRPGEPLAAGLWVGAMLAIGAGGIKEAYDSTVQGNEADALDFMATALPPVVIAIATPFL